MSKAKLIFPASGVVALILILFCFTVSIVSIAHYVGIYYDKFTPSVPSQIDSPQYIN